MNMETSTDSIYRAQVERFRRIQFVCEHDWVTARGVYAIGALWDRNFDAQPGERVYQCHLILRFRWPPLWLSCKLKRGHRSGPR
jgi:hypothetical protein